MEFRKPQAERLGVGLIFLGALVAIVFLLVQPASAVDFSVQTDNGGIAPSFSFAMANTQVAMGMLTVGTNDKDGNAVNITSNTGFTVKAKDIMSGGKIVAHTGKMAAFWSPNYASLLEEGLTNPLLLKLNGGAYTGFGSTDTTIYTGTPGSFLEPLKIRQVVVVTDKVLNGVPYKCDIMITASAT